MPFLMQYKLSMMSKLINLVIRLSIYIHCQLKYLANQFIE